MASTAPGDTSYTPYTTSETSLASTVSDAAAATASRVPSVSTSAMTSAPATSTLIPAISDSESKSDALTASTLAFVKEEEKQAAFVNPTETASNLANTATNTISEVVPSTPNTAPTQALDSTSAPIVSTTTTSISSQAGAVQIPPSNTYMFAPVTPVPSTSSAVKPTYNYPSAQNGNNAMAAGFNGVYKTLSETSKCDATDTDQAFACISGELAQCQADGTYVLKSCDLGQSCYALPKASGQTGVTVECAVPSDAAARLAVQPQLAPTTVNAAIAVTATPASSAAVFTSVSQVDSAVIISSQTTPSLPSGTPAGAQTAEGQQNVGSSTGNARTTSAQISQAATAVKASTTQSSQNEDDGGSLSKLPETESVAIPVETSTPLPQPENASHAQSEQSTTPTIVSTTYTAEDENQTSQTQAHPSKTSPAAGASATAESGPLFSVVEAASSSSPKPQDHQTQPTSSSAAPPAGPSLLAEQKPAPTPETSAVPAPSPHFIQTAEKPQQTQQADTPTAASSADNAGITFQPLGGNMGVNNNQGGSQGANVMADEKLAVPNNNGNGPIYITVTTTVTTTAYTQGP
ncbi:hypothetical protein P7C71_g5074, partial [Lecanoromycetidae sp. Uapishka_2]